MRALINNRDYEQLSAYIDGQLAPKDKQKLEERMRTRPELQQALNELRQTRALLRMAPRHRAPRNFTLTPAMVAQQAEAQRKRNPFNFWFPTLSFASAVATFALIFTLLFDLLPGRMQPATTAAVPEAQPQEAGERSAMPAAEATAPAGLAMEKASPSSDTMEAPSAAQAAPSGDAAQPPIIVWNQGGIGGGGGYGGDTLTKPGCLDGRCGGAADPPYMGWTDGRGGGGGGGGSWVTEGAPSGQLAIPPESVQSLDQPAAAESEVVKPDPSISGAGPILGVPLEDQGGQVIKREVVGEGLPVQPVEPVGQDQSQGQHPTLFGLPQMRVIQVLLALLAVITGAAALLVRRRA